MFFVRQQTNQCGLHAIQNLFKSAAVSKADIHNSCQTIHEKTGDSILNHESLGGDWDLEYRLGDINTEVLALNQIDQLRQLFGTVTLDDSGKLTFENDGEEQNDIILSCVQGDEDLVQIHDNNNTLTAVMVFRRHWWMPIP